MMYLMTVVLIATALAGFALLFASIRFFDQL